MDLGAALRSFEAVFRCHVSFHDLGPLRRCLVLNARGFHVNSFCAQVKSLGRKRERLCVAFDVEAVRERLHSGGGAFFKLCHAGALELVAPVVHHGRLAGVMFVGPFAPEGGWAEDGATLRQPLASSGQAVRDKFRALRRDEADDLRNMAELLAGSIQSALAEEPQPGATSRQERVKLFFDRDFARQDLRLEDLASWLGLSCSRCSQLLGQYFGKGFPELLAERRMEHARLLLRETFFNTETVGAVCGYPDSPYFYRVFKLHHGGETPAAYRKKNRVALRQA